MRNVIIMGSGRSGTSMVAGCLAKAGYFMGKRFPRPRASNPKGFFEGAEINRINEKLLSQVVPKRPFLTGKWTHKNLPKNHQRWLAYVPPDAQIESSSSIDRRIRKLCSNQPFCFKDPRFCYTLPVWRPFLSDTVFVCIFREPSRTVSSILKECQSVKYLRSLNMTSSQAFIVWTEMYKRILDKHRYKGDWLFIHCDQIIKGVGLDRLENVTGALVDRSFVEKTLLRSIPQHEVPDSTQKMYKKLLDLAEYNDNRVVAQ